jgi:hypothetical protein
VVVELPGTGPRQFSLEELQTGKLAERKEIPVVLTSGFEETKGDVEILSFDTKPAPESGTKPKGEFPNRRDRRERGGRQRGGLPLIEASLKPWRTKSAEGAPPAATKFASGSKQPEAAARVFPEKEKTEIAWNRRIIGRSVHDIGYFSAPG